MNGVALLAPAATDRPTTVSTALLAADVASMMARVLNEAGVDEDANFFDLGGDSLLGLMLLAEIDRVTGCKLGLSMLYDHPTAAGLAALLGGAVGNARPASLVALRPSDLYPAVFIVHGIGGSILELRDVVAGLAVQNAVFGIESPGLNGMGEPIGRVEDMARTYVEHIRQVQPEGPYLLFGYSFGGLIALEMARVLTATGSTVALLGLIDSYPDHRYWRWRTRLDAWARSAMHHVRNLRAQPVGEAAPHLLSVFRGFLGQLHNMFRPLRDRVAPPVPGLPAAAARVRDSNFLALGQYDPPYYDGAVTFFKAEGGAHFPREVEYLWRPRLRELTVRRLQADHISMLREDAEALSEAISASVRAALGRAKAMSA